MTKEKELAQIDVAMGCHYSEELFIDNNKVTTGCGNDLEKATKIAYLAVASFDMFGEDGKYISADKNQTS